MTASFKPHGHRFILHGLRWTLAAVFIYAGWEKLGSPADFSESIASFSILPYSLINPLALALPPFEIVLGLAIIIGFQRRPALLALVALNVVFSLALGSAIARGIRVDCGCFGPGSLSTSEGWDLARDFLLLAVGLILYRAELR
jgi:uncharacterized membrane protein YphA (DoxX/SURF4 family)